MSRGAVLLVLCPVLLAACGPPATPGSAAREAPVAPFEEVYARAESALAVAEAKRNVWSRTEGLLRAARTAHDDGRVEEAIRLATEARLQAELAVAQAEREKQAWRANVLSR